MIEGMPWAAQLGVAGGGWTLAFILGLTVVRKVMNGTLHPDSTVQELRGEVRALRETNHELAEQNGLLMKGAIPLTNAVMEALHRAANEVTDK